MFHTSLRRVLCLVMAVLVLSGNVLSVLADTYTVDSAVDMAQSWAQANDNSSKSNTFNMSTNIDMSGYNLEAENNKTYIINGNNHTISNVIIDDSDTGSSGSDPVVTINADVTDNNKKDSLAALGVMGDVNVTVNGDVTVKAAGGDQSMAVIAIDDATVTVKGDVSSKDSGVSVDDATLTVKGDVSLNSTTNTAGMSDVAITGNNGASISVTGDVSSVQGGVMLIDGSTATIGGDLSYDENKLTLSEGSSLRVKGDVEGEDGISVHSSSNLKVDGSTEIEGQVIISDGSSATFSTAANDGGLTITGNDLSSQSTSGLYAHDDSRVEVYGDTVATMIVSSENSYIGCDEVMSDLIIVGAGDKPKDTSKFYSTWDVSGINQNVQINASGKTFTQIIGNVKGGITASGNAQVDVWKYVDYVPVVMENAVVNTKMGVGKTETFVENTGDQYEDNIIKLCKGYTTNSSMKDHMSDLEDVLNAVSVDLVKNMGFGNALVISVVEMFNMLADEVEYAAKDMDFSNSGYNAASIKNFENADDLNTLLIETHKKTLAQALQELSPNAVGQQSAEDAKKIHNLAEKAHSFLENAGTASLSNEEKAFFEKALTNGIFSDAEARNFLIQYGGYKSGEIGIGSATKELRAMLESMKSMKAACKALKVTFTVTEFITFFNKNYSNQVAVLDNLLENQELSPEMLVAVYELRAGYDEKFKGAVDLAVEKGLNFGADKLKEVLVNTNPVLQIGSAAIELLDAAGAFDKQHALNDAAALICSAPSALQAYENAIINVKNGNTTAEDLQMVEMNYIFVRETLKQLCEHMVAVGNKTQAAEYQQLVNKLDALQLGHGIYMDTQSMLTVENFDEFYKNNVDPNVTYKYA